MSPAAEPFRMGLRLGLHRDHRAALTVRVIGNYADSLLYSSEERLVRALSAIARVYEDSQRRPVPKISQQDLASMIGITRQRVNILMKRFRKLEVRPGKE